MPALAANFRQLFAKAGLKVYGMDFSPAMLALCRDKDFAVELKQHDMTQVAWPYPAKRFDQLVCCGVLHFILISKASSVRSGVCYGSAACSLSRRKLRHWRQTANQNTTSKLRAGLRSSLTCHYLHPKHCWRRKRSPV